MRLQAGNLYKQTTRAGAVIASVHRSIQHTPGLARGQQDRKRRGYGRAFTVGRLKQTDQVPFAAFNPLPSNGPRFNIIR